MAKQHSLGTSFITGAWIMRGGRVVSRERALQILIIDADNPERKDWDEEFNLLYWEAVRTIRKDR